MKKTGRNKNDCDWSYYNNPEVPSRQKSLFDEEELAKRLAEIFVEQIEETKNKNNEN